MDAVILGQVAGWVVAAAGGAWAVWERLGKMKAANSASIAESNADRSVADSQSVVYTMLSQRLTTLESEVTSLRNELSVERLHSRKLELHIWKLEGLMRKAGLEPPLFDTANGQ